MLKDMIPQLKTAVIVIMTMLQQEDMLNLYEAIAVVFTDSSIRALKLVNFYASIW